MTMNYSEILTAAYLEGEFGGEHNRLKSTKRHEIRALHPYELELLSYFLWEWRVLGLNTGH